MSPELSTISKSKAKSPTGKKSFKKMKSKDTALIADDGTLIFKHPTVPNYYEKEDKPQIKANSYLTMMHPGYQQWFADPRYAG